MSLFKAARPWIAGIGPVVCLVAFFAPDSFQDGPDNSGEVWLFWVLLLSWVLLLVLAGIAPAKGQGLFVRYGAFLWIMAALLAFAAALLCAGIWSEDAPDDGAEWTFALRVSWVVWFSSLFAVAHLVLLSAIHLARFQVPRLRSQGAERVLVIRPRGPGGLALTLRIVGMVSLGAVVVMIFWTPVILLSGFTASSYVSLYPLAVVLALLGAGFLYGSHFAAAVGPHRPRIVVEEPQPVPTPKRK